MSKLKCVNLESGLHASNDGLCRACCLMEHQYNNEGNQLNIKSDTFEEIYNSESRKHLLDAFEQGEKPKECRICWEEESSGKKSKRLRDNERFHDQQKDGVFQIFDVNMGNTCNLKCRTCGPFSSSKWAQEWRELGFFDGDDSAYKNFLQRFNKAYDENSLFWNSFEKNLQNVLHIDFYGGEPFLVSKQWEMLKEIIGLGYAKDITIHYNTNGTIWDDEIYETLKQFKRVFIDFSIDGVYDKINYIRNPADWDLIFSNFIKVRKLHDNNQFFINICNTISILNVFYIEELIETFGPYTKDIYLNLVFWPEHYTIKNIPEEMKREITVKLLGANDRHPTFHVQNIINFMNSKTCDMDSWQKFIDITKKQDKIRDEKFETTFPEFYELMTKHGYSL